MKLLIAGIGLLSLFYSCNNDLEIYTDPVDLPFIYGSIISNDSTHYIKVTRTFQKWSNEVDESDMYYEDDSIQVYIDEYSDGNLINSFEALPVVAHDKEEGLFPHPTHKYYRVEHTLLSNKLDYRYSVRVELANGEIAQNLKPFPLQRTIGVNRPNLQVAIGRQEIAFDDATGNTVPYRFHWGQKGGGREELIFTVVFLEINTETNTTDTVNMPIVVYNDVPSGDNSGNVIELFGLYELCRGLAEHLEKNDKIKRRMLTTRLEYVGNVKEVVGFGLGLDIWSESKDLTSYETIMYSQSQDGISQDIPNFSNLSHAVGLFSTRSHRQVKPESEMLFFGQRTLDSLTCSPAFFEYNFSRCYINSMGELDFDDSSSRCDFIND